jgi:hypothetical protein
MDANHPDEMASMFDRMDKKPAGRVLPETPSDAGAVESYALNRGTIPEGYYDVPVIPGESQSATMSRLYETVLKRSGVDPAIAQGVLKKWNDRAAAGGGRFRASDDGQAISDDEFRGTQNLTDSSFRVRLDRKTSPWLFKDLEDALSLHSMEATPGTNTPAYIAGREMQKQVRLNSPGLTSLQEGAQSSIGGTLRQVGNVASYIPGLDDNALQREGKRMQAEVERGIEDREDESLRSVPGATNPHSWGQNLWRSGGTALVEAPKLAGSVALLGKAALPVLSAASEADQGLIGYDNQGNLVGAIPGAVKGYATQEAFGAIGNATGGGVQRRSW